MEASRHSDMSARLPRMQTAPTRAGHPPGLYVLFFTELWERYSFYSMMAILTLYMDEALHFSTAQIGAVYGGYIGGVYFMPLIGGFLADRVLGFNRAVMIGCVLMMIGHLVLAVESLPFFYTALVLLAFGVGFIKPNVSTIAGNLYRDRAGAARRRLQPLLHGDQPRRVHLAADRRLVPRALRLERRVRIGGRRDVPLAARLRRLQQARRRGRADGGSEIGRGAVGKPRAGAVARPHAAGDLRHLGGVLDRVLPERLHADLLGARQHHHQHPARELPVGRAARRHRLLRRLRRRSGRGWPSAATSRPRR